MSGYLEGDEIDAFLRDMLQQQGCNANTQLIKDFKQFIVRLLLNCMAQTNRNNFRVEIAEGVAKQISYGIRFLQESIARSDQAP